MELKTGRGNGLSAIDDSDAAIQGVVVAFGSAAAARLFIWKLEAILVHRALDVDRMVIRYSLLLCRREWALTGTNAQRDGQ